VKYKDGVAVTLPDFSEEIGGFAILDVSEKPVREEGDYKNITRSYKLQTYTPGAYIIPEATVAYTDIEGKTHAIITPQIFVDIKSTIKEGEKVTDIRDIKLPVFLKEQLMLYVIIGGSALVVLVIILLGVYYYRKKLRDRLRYVPPRAAHEIAFEELEKLRAMDLVKQGKMKEYYIILSDIVRHYIERRFSIKAKEQTTQEFLYEVATSAAFAEGPKDTIRKFLEICDMVKFAKYGPVPQEAEEAYVSAHEFVLSTVPKEESDEDSNNVVNKTTQKVKGA